jgi:hypothetical protein
MMTKLRATTQLLQRDLSADHFNGKLRLGSAPFEGTNVWLHGPPQQGFFQIYHGSDPTVPGNPSVVEGTDLNGYNFYRCVDHTLAFTIKVRGNQQGDFLTANAPGQLLTASGASGPGFFGPPEARLQSNSYSYQWAEVAWFLKPSVNPATGQQDVTAADPVSGAPGVPLYTLYRRQRLAVPDNSLVNPPIPKNQLGDCLDLSCWANTNNNNLYFNNPTDLTVPERRFGKGIPTNFTTLAQEVAALNPQPANAAALIGSDIQLTDVISFDVRVNNPAGSEFIFFGSADPFVTFFDPSYSFFSTGNINYGSAMVYDTWTSVVDGLSDYSQWFNFQSQFFFGFGPPPSPSPATSMPMWDGFSGPNVQAIQITIRIWDAKTNQTRQVTMVQAM